MKIITIAGKAQHGKDTTAELLKNRLEIRGKKVLLTHYADLLKYICEKFFDWDGKKDEAGRSLLQYVGTEVIRTAKPDYWVDFIKSVLILFPDKWDYVIIPDTRFPNEINGLKDDFDVFAVRVVRPNFDNGLTDAQKNHVSETALDNYEFDYTIENVDGDLNCLAKGVMTLVHRLIAAEV